MKPRFKIGDRVKCIRGHGKWLIQGKIYKVSDNPYNFGGAWHIDVDTKETQDCHGQGWYPERFVLVEDKEYDELFI